MISYILFYEFQSNYKDMEGHIKIPAYTSNLVREILKHNGMPMHLSEIFVEFKKRLPNHRYTVADQLRPYLQRHEEIAYRGRKSIYTLKEWRHIRTGTIREVISDFLCEMDIPQTAKKITEYVRQFFPETNLSSIRTTMYSDTRKRFSFFKKNLFGLTGKDYPSEYKKINQSENHIKSFEERRDELEKFILENKRFPYFPSRNREEDSLQRWWDKTLKKKYKIDENQQLEVERIKKQYAEYNMNRKTYKQHAKNNIIG
jgi:hypothetical protein